MNDEKISSEGRFYDWVQSKAKGFEYLTLMFIAMINGFVIYDLIGSPREIFATTLIVLMGIMFFRIVTCREMKNIREGKDIFDDSLFYACFYIMTSILVYSVFTQRFIFGILLPVVMFFNLQILRNYAHSRLKRKVESWLKDINFDEMSIKRELEDELNVKLSKLKGIEYFKNDEGANLFIVLREELENMDKKIESFFVSREKRVAYRAVKILEKAEKSGNFEISYSFHKFKAKINRTKKNSIIFCEGVNKGDVEAIKANF